MVNDIFRLSVQTVIILHIIVGLLQTESVNTDVEIWPNLTSFTLTSDTLEDSRTLICKGNESIQWYFRQYDGTLLTKNSSTKLYPIDKNGFTYSSSLSLSNATYLDTGLYICAPSMELKYFKKIYVFVQHETHLLAIPKDGKILYNPMMYNIGVVIPCRPTSPDVNVELKITLNTDAINGTNCGPIKPFKCRNGQCIDIKDVCDEKNDCEDGSDEFVPMCKVKPCSSEESFKCSSGKCISESSVCDGRQDCKFHFLSTISVCKGVFPWFTTICGDGSDEDKLMCKARHCLEGQFKCTSGQCIGNSSVCDTFKDCTDGSDEDEVMCQARNCLEGQFKCTNGPCLKKFQVCNGYNDCKDGSDEDEFMCKARNCLEEQFKCTNGQCISNFMLCDGYNDCKDGSDEDEVTCQTRRATRQCALWNFKCNNGQCISNSDVCDGRNDCEDGSDEDEVMCKVTRYIRLDDQIGFIIYPWIFFEYNYTCAASKNNIVDYQRIPTPSEYLLRINDSSIGNVTVGQNLTLNCSLDTRFLSIFYIMKWIVPEKHEYKFKKYTKEHYFERNILLNIPDGSFDDEGDYICMAIAMNGRNYTITYTLKYTH